MNSAVKLSIAPIPGGGLALSPTDFGRWAMELNVTPAIDGVYRVVLDGRLTGYVVEAGPVFVSLRGSVYNTAVEIGQSMRFEAAVRLLTHDALATR